MSQLNLFTASPAEIRDLMQQTDDVATLRLLADIEAAVLAGDIEAQVEAVDRIADLLVLQQGIGL